MIDLTKTEKSRGHLCFVQSSYDSAWYEFYQADNGDIYKAPISCVIDVVTGYRIGRFECPPWLWEATKREWNIS